MTIVLIGLGRIARYHIAALTTTPLYCLCGLCDLHRTPLADAYPDLPFFTDYTALLDALHPDAAVIATPPATHLDVVESCLKRGVLPMVEKPLAETAEEGLRFFAPDLRGRYVPMHHTAYGEEMLWFAAHCPLRHIESVRMVLEDPYATPDGRIDPARYGLGGSWMDSAPNALAPLMQLLPLSSLSDIRLDHRTDPQCGLPYSSRLTARAGETEVEIAVHWETGHNSKQTFIEADGHHYVLHHSDQAVWRDGEQLFAFDRQERLLRQYSNFYRLYPEGVPAPEELEQMYQIIYHQ